MMAGIPTSLIPKMLVQMLQLGPFIQSVREGKSGGVKAITARTPTSGASSKLGLSLLNTAL